MFNKTIIPARPQPEVGNYFPMAGQPAAGAGGTSGQRRGNRLPDRHQPISKQKVRTPKASLVGELFSFVVIFSLSLSQSKLETMPWDLETFSTVENIIPRACHS